MSLNDNTMKIASVLAKVNALLAQLRAKMESSLWGKRIKAPKQFPKNP